MPTIDAMAGKELTRRTSRPERRRWTSQPMPSQDLALGGTEAARCDGSERPGGRVVRRHARRQHCGPRGRGPEGTSMLGAIEKPRPRVPSCLQLASSGGAPTATTHPYRRRQRPNAHRSRRRAGGGRKALEERIARARAPPQRWRRALPPTEDGTGRLWPTRSRRSARRRQPSRPS